jgi:hypothetical protein
MVGTAGMAGNATGGGSGTAGAGGVGESSGGAGTGGAGAGAGNGGAGGVEDDDPVWPAPQFCSEERSIVPECFTVPLGGMPLSPLANPRHVGLNTVSTYGGWHLVVSENGGHTVRINWGDDTVDVDWRCFDTVPYADRLAGTNLTNDLSEWFVTTQCGDLYVRRIIAYLGGGVWTQWTPFSLPTARSFVLDVATSLSAEGFNYVFIVDRGRVLQRHRLGTDNAAFSAWQEVAAPPSRLLAAGLRADGRQQLFLVNEAGDPSTCIQVSNKLGADFSECVDFGSADVPELVHIAAPYRVPGGSPVLALDVDGAVWVRFPDEYGGFDAWEPFEVAPPEPLVSISGGGVPNWTGAPFRVAGVTRSGFVYMIVRRNGAWGTWSPVF